MDSIVVAPNVVNIDNLFKQFTRDLEQSINEVRQFEGTGDTVNDKKLELLSTLKDGKIEFDHSFISLVRSVDRSKAVALTNHINRLDDIATECLSSSDFTSINFRDIRDRVYQIKSEFYGDLYKHTSIKLADRPTP